MTTGSGVLDVLLESNFGLLVSWLRGRRLRKTAIQVGPRIENERIPRSSSIHAHVPLKLRVNWCARKA